MGRERVNSASEVIGKEAAGSESGLDFFSRPRRAKWLRLQISTNRSMGG
jgi:hypothetical protein